MRGFSLLEIMIVLALVAGIFAIGLPAIKTKESANRKIIRELALLGKAVRNQSRLKNMTHRIAFKMDEKENSYWVESAQGSVLTKSKEDRKAEDHDPANPFQKTTKFFKEDRVLPKKLFIGSVETESTEEALTRGIAYIYFSPEGLIEKSVIQITDRDKMTTSLTYNPLTGHADIIEKPVHLRELRQE